MVSKHKKPKPELEHVNVPPDILRGGYNVADKRIKPFLQYWATRQLFVDDPKASMEASLQFLLRQVYLQGLWDGYTVGTHDPFDGLGLS